MRQQAAQDADYAAKRAESEKHWEQVRAERKKMLSELMANLQGSLKPMNAIPKGECSFVTVNDGGEAFLYVVCKKGFGLCYASIKYSPGVHAGMVDRTRKMKLWKDKLPHIAQRAARGQVFAI